MGVSDDLEKRARSAIRNARSGSESIEAQIDREIAVVSERIDRIKKTREVQYVEIVHEEFRIKRELSSLASHAPNVFSYAPKLRERMKKRLADVAHERRKHRNEGTRDIEVLHDRLLRLFKQRDLLGGA